jgi:hypothetical protein
MPTIIKESGFRLFFYSNELDEKVHVHVQYQSAVAKFWLKPVFPQSAGLQTMA